MNNAMENNDDDDDEWNWDEEENMETETTTKKAGCTVNISNPHLFGFYEGRSGAALQVLKLSCYFRYQWYGEEHEDTEDREK